jgi:UDP:flavonoid glycosyltransferase YjiC (YdhE family)
MVSFHEGADMHIVYYITSHGYGHAVRTAAICNAFSPDVRITFRTTLPQRFFHEEVRREFTYAPAEYDCGCIQKDSLTTDVEKTLETYAAIALKNESSLAEEVQWCRGVKADIIVSDIASFAFEVAEKAGIPSAAVTNFTWVDVYARYIDRHSVFLPVQQKMEEQYAMATLLCALEPALPMSYFSRRVDFSPVGRTGRNRRSEIIRKYGFANNRRICLIYFGYFGIDNIDWKQLEQFDSWEFLGLFPLSPRPANYHLIPKADFPYQDLAASVDLVLCKIGYCVVSESVLHGIPFIYLPRDDFAESAGLESAIARWGAGYRLTHDQLQQFSWGDILSTAEKRGKIHPVVSNGAGRCAREIERLVR